MDYSTVKQFPRNKILKRSEYVENTNRRCHDAGENIDHLHL